MNVARFDRIAVVLSGGGALGAYQAGALATMSREGFHPNWFAATGIGAFNAAIVAGNAPSARVERLYRFWQILGTLRPIPPRALATLRRRIARLWPRRISSPDETALACDGSPAECGWADIAQLRALLRESIDFARLNLGATHLSLGAIDGETGGEVWFDNSRIVLDIDHVLASAASSGSALPIVIEGQSFGGAVGTGMSPTEALPMLLDRVAPADTLCFLVDCIDPLPRGLTGSSRTGRQITAYRRWHDLRGIIDSLCERIPEDLREDPEIRRCLAHGSPAIMSLVHLVHESSNANLASKLRDFSEAAIGRHWQAGEQDMRASLAQPAWITPPPRRAGVMVHELREGTALPPIP